MSECDLADTIEHHATMTRYASQCDVICEFGVHLGGSTRAFLRGVKGRLESWDIDHCGGTRAEIQDPKWIFHHADSREANIPECDMLFIDSEHTKRQVAAELLHAGKVRKWLMFHDTMSFPTEVLPAVLDFLAQHPEWRVLEHYEFNHGLLLLERA